MTNGSERMAILGGRGMLGTDLQKAARQHGFTVGVFDLPEFDITNERHLRGAIADYDVIVNCAAYTNVDGAESNAETAYAVNAGAAERLGRLAVESDKYVLHISTDFVFDGRKDGPYDETELPNPLGVYGRTKLQGEQLLSQTGCRHSIVRVQWTYGKAGNNFVSKMIQLARGGKPLKVIDDQVGSPTATIEVAAALCDLLAADRRPEGLFHYAAAGYVNRCEQARFIFDTLKLKVDVSPCRSADYATAAERPLNSRFDCDKIQRYLDKPIRPWQEPLAEFLEQL
ncbi:MAG: dTDP-4-dehydrorhamnose reductase [Phycisphaerae bacterium]|nr:dTDP-4-dehydrorhamnose reductase [Phycisphaerae bacterium]